MSSKSIYTCVTCDQSYCGECSDADSYDLYCSRSCENEAENEVQ